LLVSVAGLGMTMSLTGTTAALATAAVGEFANVM
jgi:hypothetical protein